jgi:hypothetical protein
MSDHESSQAKRGVNIRRSTRVSLRIPINVSGQLRDNKPFNVEAHTLVVNANGALIVLGMNVRLGQSLLLQHTISQEYLDCRVVHIGQQHDSKSEIGIVFSKPALNFWHITFPVTD